MRQGDFSIEVVPRGGGRVRELSSGHVLARPRQQYGLRIRNHGPLYTVAAVEVDGRAVTAGGLVIAPWSATELERPIGTTDDGRFTVIAEGDEAVFGEDGGRDNEKLGLIVARFRRELPRGTRPLIEAPDLGVSVDVPARPMPSAPTAPSRYPGAPPEWNPPGAPATPGRTYNSTAFQVREPGTMAPPNRAVSAGIAGIERAAGTGLTGHSSQQFEPIALGPLEHDATTLTLRIVIGSEQAIDEEPAPSLENDQAPARPAARP